MTRPSAGATRRTRPSEPALRTPSSEVEATPRRKGERFLLRTCFVKITFLTDVVEMGYSEDEIFAMLNESEQDRKRRQVLAKVTETVAAYRLREMKDFQAREKLTT